MKIRKIHFFNMIEILLALAVIAIGMTSILGLFPVGLNASRNAVAQNVSSDVADQMITYLRTMNELDTTGDKYVAHFLTPATCYRDIKYAITAGEIADVETKSKAFLTSYNAGTTTADGFPRVAPGWSIFKTPVTFSRVFFIVQGPNCTEDTGNHPVDYSAMALVWKSTVQIQRLNPDGSGWGLWPPSASYTDFGQLNIELSWPLELPYAERKKRYYQIVISKPL